MFANISLETILKLYSRFGLLKFKDVDLKFSKANVFFQLIMLFDQFLHLIPDWLVKSIKTFLFHKAFLLQIHLFRY